MKQFSIKFKNLGGFIPKWGDPGDAALDLKASVDMAIKAGQRDTVPLGIASEFPPTYVALIKDRSGLASKGYYIHGGVIDSSYRGEWKVIIENATTDAFGICRGDRIAQVIFVSAFHLLVEEVDKLQDSVRGVSGFGSSGR
jgi:dUTP pyrophosphatase